MSRSFLFLLAFTLLAISSCSKAQPPRQVVVEIKGMTCGSCVNAITSTLQKMPGVIAVKVELKAERATIRYQPADVKKADLVSAINRLGYKARLPSVPGETTTPAS